MRLTALLVVLGLPGCGDGGGEGPPTGGPSPNTASASIGPAGGTLETTADDGTVYTLTVPADAIPTGLTISMTPISSLEGFPLASGIVGGVELAPTGTVFTAPATLEIRSTAGLAVGELPLAILFSGEEPSLEASVAGFDSGTFSVPMTHFSGATVGFATAQELQGLVAQGNANCVASAVLPSWFNPPDAAAVQATFDACFESVVLPALEGATTDVQLATAIGGFSMWKTDSRVALGAALFTSYDDAAKTTLYFDALVGKLQEAITHNNELCEDGESLAGLANVLFWQTQAARFGIDTVAHLLDRATVLRDLCAHAVIDSVDLPDDLDVGFPYSLDLQAGLLFTGNADSQGVPFEIQLVGDGVDVQNPTGFTDAQGAYTSVITPTESGSLSVAITACLIYPGTQTASDVCVLTTASTDAIDLTGIWTETTDSSVCMNLAQNQNAVSGTLHMGEAQSTMLGTLSGSQLLNVSVEGNFGEAYCSATGTGAVDGDTFTLNLVTDAPCNVLSLLFSFARGGTCP